MPGSVVAAVCTHCHGEVPLRFSGPLACPYCGAVDALSLEVLKQVMGVRGRLAGRRREMQQFQSADGVFAKKFLVRLGRHLWVLVMLWTIMTCMFFGICGTMVGKDVSILALLAGRVALTTDELRLTWGCFYTASYLMVFTFVLPTFGLIQARRVAFSARAFVPAKAGAPPRCRCCLAELPAAGALRRCAYCGADHLVLDENYQAEQASLDAMIRAAVAESQRSLATRLKHSEWLISWTGFSVLLSLFVMPCIASVMAAVIDQPTPGYFVVPAVAFAITLVIYVRAWRKVKDVVLPARQVDSGTAPVAS